MSRTRTALTSADKIAIAMCKSNGTPVPVIAKYFPVGERQIWRILAEFPVKYPDVSEAIDKFKKISEGISQKQEEEEPEPQFPSPMEEESVALQESHALSIEAPGDHRKITAKVNSMCGVIKKLKTKIAKDNLKINRLLALQSSKDASAKKELMLSMLRPKQTEQPKNPILLEMEMLSAANPHARRFSDRFLRFAYSLITYSPAAYGFVRKLLPLPARSTIYSRFSDAVSRMKANLTDLKQTYNLLEAFIEARKP